MYCYDYVPHHLDYRHMYIIYHNVIMNTMKAMIAIVKVGEDGSNG